MTDTQVILNDAEVNILLFAMNNLTLADEKRLAEEYGSVPALYNKLYSLMGVCAS
jgi:hypothetical protein